MDLETKKLAVEFEHLPFNTNLISDRVYLVGGSVRDVLLGRKADYLDLDFVVSRDSIATAKKIARYHNGGFVVLDESRQIARVVIPQGTLDFALQEGNSIETDLQRRDFTLNAIAFDLQKKEIIDPHQGIKDIQNRSIKMISKSNLEDDPLRLLRAYRQATQLNFSIEINTRDTIKSLIGLLSTVATERVNTELNYILTNLLGDKWLKSAYEDGLLCLYFSQLSDRKINLLPIVTTTANNLIKKYPDIVNNFTEWMGLAKLAVIVADNPDKAELELEFLKYPRSHIKAVVTTLKSSLYLLSLNSQMSLREQYFFFLEAKDIFPIIALIVIARDISPEIIYPLIERYLNSEDKVAHPQPLVTGNDLIKQLNIKPSPIIGELLTEIAIAYIEDKISNVGEALDFATNYLKKF